MLSLASSHPVEKSVGWLGTRPEPSTPTSTSKSRPKDQASEFEFSPPALTADSRTDCRLPHRLPRPCRLAVRLPAVCTALPRPWIRLEPGTNNLDGGAPPAQICTGAYVTPHTLRWYQSSGVGPSVEPRSRREDQKGRSAMMIRTKIKEISERASERARVLCSGS